jgi:hypothetical protein
MAEQTPQQQPSPAQAAAMAAVARSTKLTGRAALLAVVICAIDQLLATQQTISAQVKALQAEDGQLSQTWYIEQEAEDQLHMCFPQEQCYEVVSGASAQTATAKSKPAVSPWYAKLWQSVQQADAPTSK